MHICVCQYILNCYHQTMHMHYTRVSMAKPNSVVLFLVIFFLANSMKEGFSIIQCPEIEKEALLSFKHSVVDSSNRLSSWNTSNCCDWGGVVCSNVTGNVHQLHLKGDGWYWHSNSSLQGKINPSLLKLKHLKYLDLSQNAFYERIPSFMGSLTSLEYLNLSYNEFYGKIPPTIGNLSRLHTLSLEGNWELHVDSLEWLRGLSQLEHLNMGWVNLTKASSHWMQVINALPSLVDLRLSYCSLSFISDPPSADFNITSLEILDLSGNCYDFESFPIPLSGNYYDFESFPIPNWIFKQSNLVFLDLSVNKFEGPIPAISNITKLRYIDLSVNNLNSTIPDWLYSCKDLEFVYMTYNSLQGSISNAIGNLTSLTTLDLSHNQLSGEIPMSLGQLSNLEHLSVENNKMRGVVTESQFVNLTKLGLFSASGNHLTLKLSPNWNPPFKLNTLRLRSWNLGAGSGILSWLETQKSTLNKLDLSNTGISGNVPTWFWDIGLLNLTNNQLSGYIPSIIGSYIYLSSNQFSGPLPLVGNGTRELNLSNNSFSGGISHFLCDMITHDAWYRCIQNNLFPSLLRFLVWCGLILLSIVSKYVVKCNKNVMFDWNSLIF